MEAPRVAWSDNERNTKYVFKVPQRREAKDKGLEKINFPIPGLDKFFETSKPRSYRYGWILLVLIASAISFYQVGTRVKLYLKGNTEFLYEDSVMNKIVLPSVTICLNENVASSELRERKYNYDREHNQHLLPIKPHWHLANTKTPPELIGTVVPTAEELWSLWDPKEFISFSVDKMIFANSMEPQIEEIAVRTVFGTCRSITMRNQVVYRPNLEWNFTVNLMDSYSISTYPSIGVLLHYPDDPFVHLVASNLIEVALRFKLTILLTFKKIVVMNTKEKPCVSKDIHKDCLNRCYNQLMESSLDCRLPFLTESKLDDCINGTSAKTARENAETIYRKNDKCRRLCNRPCELDIITSFISNDRVDVRNIYFSLGFLSNSNQTVTETLSYDVITFLCDIGGNLGLFLGICILHILEIFDSLVHYCCSKFTVFRNKREH